MITNKQLEKVKGFSVNLDWNLAFGGKSKGNQHLFRVNAITKKLSSNENVRRDICEAGAWLHDSGLAENIKGDALCNKAKVIKFLESINVGKNDIEEVLKCIASHDGIVTAQTKEAKIVHDADTLDKMGPLGVIRETWKRSQMGWTSDEIVKHLKEHINKRFNNLYTEKAKIIAKKLNQPLTAYFSILEKQENPKIFR
jgi:HD superfamily phosphodiesterase